MNSEKNDNSKMVSKQFFGEIAPEEPKECAIMTLINNMSDNLTNQLYDAKLKFADATLDKDNWSMAKEREIACKVIEGQITILAKLRHDFESMLTPMPTMAMAG